MGELSNEVRLRENISNNLATLRHSPFVTAKPRHFPRRRGQLLYGDSAPKGSPAGELSNEVRLRG